MTTEASPGSGAHAPGASTTDGRLAGALACLALVALPLVLFRDHVLRLRTYLGNPDRLNNSLKVLQHYVEGFDAGRLAAWNNGELLGYDSFALVHIYPNPLARLAGAFGADRLYVVDGFVSISLLIVAGIAAYAFLREFVQSRLAAFCGALIYQFSALSLLKVSQNDTSFAVFIVIPLALLAVRRLGPEGAVRGYAALFLLLAAAFHFMFLQKVAYAVVLIAAYAAYRSRAQRTWLPAFTTGAAMAAAFAVALPRLVGFAITMTQYARRVPDRDFSRFKGVYEFQNIHWYEILRWFDGTIFGKNPSDAGPVGNNINLSEGWLLYAGCAATLFSLAVLARYRGRWFAFLRKGAGETRFFVWVMIFGMLAVASKPFIGVLYYLFLRVDLTHARMLIISLLPFCLLVALAIEHESGPPPERWSGRDIALFAAALAVAFVVARLLAMESEYWKGFSRPLFGHDMHLRKAAVLHVALTGMVIAILWLLRRSWPPGAPKTRFCSTLLVGLVLAQAVLFADQRINAPVVRNSAVPFSGGDLYAAPADAFRPPTDDARSALQARLQNERFRSVVLCDPWQAGGLCAAHIAAFWGLRLADGYYGTGVPRRIAALPWDAGIGLRSVSFTDPGDIPWKLLALLNVRQALAVDLALYENVPRLAGARDAAEMIARAKILENPYPVTPRVFFARAIESAESAEDAATRVTFTGDAAPDAVAKSYVEGLGSAAGLGGGSDIRLSEGADWIQAEFAASDRPRFLVFNELYYPGWAATVGGAAAPVLATNAVMRGVAVPPGAGSVRLEYTTFSRSRVGRALYVVGLLAFALGLWAVGAAARRERRRPVETP